MLKFLYEKLMYHKKNMLLVGIFFISIVFFCAHLSADVPATINYQGRLKESGLPANGGKTMRFKIWDASAVSNLSGGAAGSIPYQNATNQTTYAFRLIDSVILT